MRLIRRAIAGGYGDVHDETFGGAVFDVRGCARVLVLPLRRDLYSNRLVTVPEGLFNGLTKLEFL